MIVEVEQGKLEGLIQKSVLTGNDYYAFLGVPYAKPPVGELRFQHPQPAEKWDGVLYAKKEGSPCIQKFFTGEYIGSEDCLYLNVYTSTLPVEDTTPKAVMVFFHGGAFLAGSGSPDIYSPDYLIGYNIILVTVNYRLHALGFLNMGTENNADNCGLRDQWFALKWVNENIKQFGGDSKNITIFGSSAGGASVYYHMISPKSKGLFNKAIIQSDPVYSLRDDTYNSRQTGFDLAKKLGYQENDPEKVVEFLRSRSAMEITKNSIFSAIVAQKVGLDVYYKIMRGLNFRKNVTYPLLEKGYSNSSYSEVKVPNKIDLSNIFQPSAEGLKDDAFLPGTMEDLRKNATPVPLIIGLNNKEGRAAFSFIGSNMLEILENGFSEIIRRPCYISDSEFQNICNKIKKQYLGDEPVSDETAEKIVDVLTDYWYRKLYESFDFIIDSGEPVYLYEFTFMGKLNIFDKIYLKGRPDSTSGAAHSDELPYLFYPKLLLQDFKEFCEPETTVIKHMCSLWVNFAKTSNPTENYSAFEWRKFTSEKPCFLRIDENLKLIEEKLREKEFGFWNDLLQ